MSWFYLNTSEQCDIYLPKHRKAIANLEGMVKSLPKAVIKKVSEKKKKKSLEEKK